MTTPLTDTERAIKQAILLYLGSRRDTLVWNNPTGSAILPNGAVVRYGCVGSPDIIGVIDGRPLGVEVKTATGRQSDAQRAFEARWVACGGLYILARSIDDVQHALRRAGCIA